MFDHLTLPVADLARAGRFYDAALAPLGLARLSDFVDGPLTALGYGREPPITPFLLVYSGKPFVPMAAHHLAFAAPNRAAVDAFHRAALAAGGRDNGAPGLRPHYHPDYYAAFVIDPDGHHIEAVCHDLV